MISDANIEKVIADLARPDDDVISRTIVVLQQLRSERLELLWLVDHLADQSSS